jgi:hypothetical protein
MRILRFVATGMAVFTIGGCADGRTIVDPEPPARSVQDHASALAGSPARRIQASGLFDAIVDFTTLTLTPRGRNCLIQVKGQLVFTGTLEGPATGQTTALVFASCPDVAANPPGTFPDVFHSELVFDGRVDGEPAEANVRYMGRSEAGGHIAGRLLLSHGVEGRLVVDAQLAEGGEYEGSVVVH